MKIISSYAWKEGERYALTLLQMKRKKGNLPILFAGICADAGLAEQWEEWFQEKALPDCRKGREDEIAERVRKQFEGWMDERDRRVAGETMAGKTAGAEFVMLFCAGGECFYAWRGDMDLQALNMQFGRAQAQSLTRRTARYGCERVLLEENVGLLLGAGEFYRKLSREAVKSCLMAVDLNSQQQADRHLAELVGEAARCGAESRAAILAVTKGV